MSLECSLARCFLKLYILKMRDNIRYEGSIIMKNLKRLLCLLLSFVMLLGVLAVGASAEEIAAGAADPNTPRPYMYSIHTESKKDSKLTMSGKVYYDAISFKEYGGASTPSVAYNFKGLYESLTFDAGYVSGYEGDAELIVKADGVVVYIADIKHEDVAKAHTVSLEGVNQLVISFSIDGRDHTQYAIGNIKAEPAGTLPEEELLISCEGFDYRQYLLTQAEVINEPFQMGGNQYRNGYELYVYAGKGPKICFNFDGKYKKISFDIARKKLAYVASEGLALKPGYLTIEADGKVLPEYDKREMKWNDLVLHVEVDLTGVTQLIIRIDSGATDWNRWGIGDIQITCDKNGHVYDNNVDGICNMCAVNRETVEKRQVVHMHRLYNPNTGEHFYTGSDVEKNNLIAAGWNYEDIGFSFPANTGAPVHRLFQPSTGEHLYTMDEAEKTKLEAEGWNYEGIAFNSAYDTEAIQHRLHNPNATVGAYHFTFSEEEKQTLIDAGWEYQGIGWYSCWK